MNRQFIFRRVVSALLVVLLTVMLIVPMTLPVSAANKRFITEIRLESGEDAVATLEADGWSVTMVGLNVTSEAASQVYLAYKMNTGSPITNVILSPDVGDSYTDKDGIVYRCVSHVDVNEGIGGGAGCLYATSDARVGEPLVGLDVLRGSKEEGETLYPITNDGAQIVRTPSGAPADLEAGSDTNVVYLAQIRDGIVRPYISEIGVITDSDKWNAVYTASERGYDYYVDGDIDDSSETYTIIGYDRTADPAEAVTGITAVSARTVKALEDENIVDASANQSDQSSAAAVTISDAEYVRISGKPIEGEEPFYIYRSKDKKAGNPISMLYAEKTEQKQNFLMGTWANGYFFSPGVTTAYTFSVNDDRYSTLPEDQTVLTKLPVQLLDSFASADSPAEPTEAVEEVSAETESPMDEQVAQEEEQQNAEEANNADPEQQNAEEANNADSEQQNAEEANNADSEQQQGNEEGIENAVNEGENPPAEENPEVVQEAEAETESDKPVKCINLSILTPRDGLPDTASNLTGMRGDPAAPYVERTERGDRVNKFQASVFGKGGVIALIIGGVLIVALAVYAVIRKKRSDGKESENSKKENKPGKAKKAKKQYKSKKSR